MILASLKVTFPPPSIFRNWFLWSLTKTYLIVVLFFLCSFDGLLDGPFHFEDLWPLVVGISFKLFLWSFPFFCFPALEFFLKSVVVGPSGWLLYIFFSWTFSLLDFCLTFRGTYSNLFSYLILIFFLNFWLLYFKFSNTLSYSECSFLKQNCVLISQCFQVLFFKLFRFSQRSFLVGWFLLIKDIFLYLSIQMFVNSCCPNIFKNMSK